MVLETFSNHCSPRGPPLRVPLSVNSQSCRKISWWDRNTRQPPRGPRSDFPCLSTLLEEFFMSDRSASKSGHVGAGPGQGQGQGSPRPEGPAPRSHRSTWEVPGQPWFPGRSSPRYFTLTSTLQEWKSKRFWSTFGMEC